MAARVSFARSLYLQEAVEEAARAYAQHVPIKIEAEGDCWVAELASDDPDLADAFGNHALFETIKRRQAGREAKP